MLAPECESSGPLLSDFIAEAAAHHLLADLLDAVDEEVLHLGLLGHVRGLGRSQLPDLSRQLLVLFLQHTQGVSVVSFYGLHELLDLFFLVFSPELAPLA